MDIIYMMRILKSGEEHLEPQTKFLPLSSTFVRSLVNSEKERGCFRYSFCQMQIVESQDYEIRMLQNRFCKGDDRIP